MAAGRSQTLTYTVPKGTYVEASSVPDPKTGINHANTGMLELVQLR